jgi:hypothetical protein
MGTRASVWSGGRTSPPLFCTDRRSRPAARGTGARDARIIQAGVGIFGTSWAELVRDVEGTTLEAIVEPVVAGRAWAGAVER